MIFSTGYILFVLAVTSNANWKVGKQRKYILTEIEKKMKYPNVFNFFLYST